MYLPLWLIFLLFWCALGGLLPAGLTAASVIVRTPHPFWKRVLYSVIAGPSFWAVLAIAVIIGVIVSIVHSVKARRAASPKT
jgi:hypothetical protein